MSKRYKNIATNISPDFLLSLDTAVKGSFHTFFNAKSQKLHPLTRILLKSIQYLPPIQTKKNVKFQVSTPSSFRIIALYVTHVSWCPDITNFTEMLLTLKIITK